MKKFLFIHVHKTGGTSLKEMLGPFKQVDFVERKEFDDLQKTIKTKYSDHEKFALVRNPYSRFKSNFSMFKRRWPKITFEEIIEIIKDNTIEHSADKFFTKKNYIKRHTLPMSHPFYCVVENDKINIDHIFRFEEFDNSVKKISNLLGTNIPMKEKNKSSKPHSDLTEEQKQTIYEIYKKDFEIFSYKK